MAVYSGLLQYNEGNVIDYNSRHFHGLTEGQGVIAYAKLLTCYFLIS